MKYWILGLSLMVMACSHSVDVKDQASYKCGDQIIRVTVLNDNSMIVHANGIDHVLTKVASPAGEKYEDAEFFKNRFVDRARIGTFSRRNGQTVFSAPLFSLP